MICDITVDGGKGGLLRTVAGLCYTCININYNEGSYLLQ